MALITKILLPLLLIGIVHGNIIVQIEQKVDSCCGGCCPCDSCDTTTEAQTQPPTNTAYTTTEAQTQQPTNITYPPCVFDVIEVGDKKFIFFEIYRNFNEAQDYCKIRGWNLAICDTFQEFEDFNAKMPGGEEFWVDVLPNHPKSPNTPLTWYWQTTPERIVTSEEWKEGRFNKTTRDDGKLCASILKDDALEAFDCERMSYFACEYFENTQISNEVCPKENRLMEEEKQINVRDNSN